MEPRFGWTDVDVIIRQCSEVILEGHRWVKNGGQSEGLSDASNFKIACTKLRDRLDKVIDGKPSNLGMMIYPEPIKEN